MKRQRAWELILIGLAAVGWLTGCNYPGSPAAAATPTVTQAASDTPEPSLTPATPEAIPVQCGWVWAEQALPETSAQWLAALQAAGIETNRAETRAYGENCLDAQGQVVRFAMMQVDFYADLPAADLTDLARLGEQAEQVLSTLAAFPAADLPARKGYIGLNFQAGASEKRLWLTFSDAEAALSTGLHGAPLFEALDDL